MSKKKRFFWSVITLIIGVLVFAYNFKGLNFKQITNQIIKTNYWWLILAFFLMLIYFALIAKTIIILSDSKNNLTLKDTYRIPLLEQFGNGVTPMSFGGQPMQLLGLTQSGVSLGEATSISIMRFVIYQGMIMLTFFISLIIGFTYVAQHLQRMMILVIFGIVIHFSVLIFLIFVMFSPKITHVMAVIFTYPIGWFTSNDKFDNLRSKLFEKIDDFHNASNQILKDKKKLIQSSLLTLIQLFIFYSIPFFVLKAFHIDDANFWFVMILNVILTMAVSIFPIPGGSGGAEYGFQLLFAGFIVQKPTLVLAMLVWRLLTYYLGLFGGILAYNLVPNKKHERK
ncbi:MAG: flippase-like domain-containing protein [Lactobacillaceae bacterium]|jgi:uncharacterized protein (TIRG00374 family)|nr:flippase-like domain-containing protein [Lactobacillaceae bacterium]